MGLRLDSLSLRLGALFVALLVTAALVVGYLFDRAQAEAMEHRELERLKLQATRAVDHLSRQVERLRRDALFLSETPPVQGIRRSLAAGGIDPMDGSTDAQWRARLQKLFLAFAETRPAYFQLRLIGAADEGRELVRVERNEGELRVVAAADLQRKGHRYYFEQAARLPAGTLYLSRVDLNRERGRIEPERIPTLRVATPVRGPGGDLFGVIVVNMDMALLFERLQEYLDESERLYIVDEEGNFLHHPDQEKTFAFEFGRSLRAEDVFGEQAARIADPGSDLGRILELGQNQGKETAFAVTRSLDAGESSRSLTLLLSRPTELIAQEADPMRREGLATMGILLLGAVFLALLTVRHLTASLRQVASAAHAIAHGNYQTPLPAVAGGEVGLLVSAFRRMAAEVSIRESSLEELNRNLERRVDERTSDLKRSRAELVRQQVLQRLVLEGISEGVVVADTRGRFLLWNRKASAIIGSRPDDIDPSRWSEHFGVYHKEDGELVPSEQLPLTRAIHGESTNDVEVFVRKGKSDGRWISVVGRPLRDQNGQLEGGVVTLRDITERKRLQSRLEDHQRELARVGRLALIGEIAAMASHQLSQPVAAISNYAGAALQLQRNNRLGEARLAEILGHINRLAERAGRALDNLRSLARRREVPPTGVDFSAVARSCVEVVADRLTRDGIQVTCDLAEHLPTLRGDPMELEQLLLHLVFNALDALEHLPHERRRMWIRTKWESEPERVLVEVGDSGNGISPAIQDRLFEPWVTDKPDGLGVGLSIVRTLAENYGGRVWMAPADPSGSVFSVEFPVGEGTT